MQQPSLEGLWDIGNCARYLGMSIAYVRKAVRLRRIPFTRIGTKALRFSKADLDTWLAAQTEHPGQSQGVR